MQVEETGDYYFTKFPGLGTVTVCKDRWTALGDKPAVIIVASGTIIAVATPSDREAAISWSMGVPAVYSRASLDAGISLAERVLPHVATVPLVRDSRVGFRFSCISPGREREVPWWEWSGDHVAQHISPAEFYSKPVRPHKDRKCTGFCGFHHTDDPWAIAVAARAHYRPILVTAPFGRVVRHGYGKRSSRYEVVAAVYPDHSFVSMPLPPYDDPRIVRARNVPLRAYEIAKELLAFSGIDRVDGPRACVDEDLC